MTNGKGTLTSLPAQAGVLGVEALQPAPPAPSLPAAPPAPTPSKPLPGPTPLPEPAIPKEATLVSKSAQGEPAVWEHQGEQYYDKGSTMYDMGFRTRTEHWNAQHYGLAYGPHPGSLVPEGSLVVQGRGWADKKKVTTQYLVTPDDAARGAFDISIGKGKYEVPVVATSERGETAQFLFPRETYEEISRMKPADQFLELQRLGVYPPDWTWAGQVGRGRIVQERLVSRSLQTYIDTKGELDLYSAVRAGIKNPEIYKRAGFDVNKRDIENIERELRSTIQLPDGTRLSLKSTKGKTGWNDIPSKYQSIGLRRGYGAMVEAMEADQREFEASHTELPDKRWISNSELKAIKKASPIQYRILTERGYDAYVSAVEDAKAALKDYQVRRGEYDIAKALLTRKPEVTKAVELLFPAEVVEKVRYEKMPGLTIGTERIAKIEPSPVSERLTVAGPVRERQDLLAQVPKPVLAAAGVTAATPVPGSRVAVLVFITAVLGGITAANFIRKYKSENKALPAINDIVILQGKGAKATVVVLDPEKVGLPPLKPGVVKGEVPGVEATKVKETGTELKPVKVPYKLEGIRKLEPEKVVLTTPSTKPEELGIGTLIKAQVATKQAENATRKAIPLPVQTIPINYNKILEEAKQAESAEQRAKAFQEINRAVRAYRQSFSPDVAAAYYRAYQEYIRRKAALDAARRAYIAALNPQPLKGQIGEDAISAVAGAKLLNLLGKKTEVKSKAELTESLERADESLINSLAQTYSKTYTKAKTQGETDAQAKAMAETALAEAVAEATEAMTRTATQVQPKVATRVAAKATVRTATATTVPKTAVAETARIATATTTPLVPPPPGKGASDKEKRQFLDKVEGLVARKRGHPKGGGMWFIDYYPYGPNDKMVLRGAAPKGAKPAKGKGSLKASATLIRGKPPSKPLFRDTGAVDDIISHRGGGKIAVRSVPDKEAKKGKPPPPGKGASDKEKRQFLDKVEGLVARKRGHPKGGGMWFIDYYPYGPNDKMVLRGAAPKGAKPAKGKGSLKASATLIRGKPPSKPLFRDTGAVDDIISHKGGGKIAVRSVPDKDVTRERKTKPRKPQKLGRTRTYDIGQGIEIDGRGHGHIKL